MNEGDFVKAIDEEGNELPGKVAYLFDSDNFADIETAKGEHVLRFIPRLLPATQEEFEQAVCLHKALEVLDSGQ